ncbi:MAG: DUF1592 domain-containing protein [Planctomycetota bacterium]|nr:DUF1592 domain-containing protein [Planctomycetota bacterium]
MALRSTAFLLLALAAAAVGGPARAGQEPVPEPSPNPLRPFLEQHCLRCHSGERPDAGLDLAGASARALPVDLEGSGAEIWSWVHERLVDGTMPPLEEPRPDPVALTAAIATLAPFALEQQEVVLPSGPRRLTRRELAYAVEDLTGVLLGEADLPLEADLHALDVVASGALSGDAWLEAWVECVLAVADEAIALPEPERAPTQRFLDEDLEGPRGSGGRLATNGAAVASVLAPRAGRYRISARAFADQAGEELARVGPVADERVLDEVELTGEGSGAAAWVTAEVELGAGPHRVGLAFLNDYYAPEAEDPGERDRNLTVMEVRFEGPLDPRPETAFQRELFARADVPRRGDDALPDLATLLIRRAWRRWPTRAELDRLEEATRSETSLEARLRVVLAAVLASPHFLLVTPLQPAAPRPAERLALALWSSLPDEALLEAEERGRLRDRDGLLREVRRMLADPRAERLSEGFVPQWLQLRRLASHAPDPALFPEFDADLRSEMLREPVDLFARVLVEGLSVRELLTATHTRVGARLAQHYGLGGGAAASVDMTATPRRGLLGMAAPLTAASDPARTSPVLRGKWVLEALLGAPPPPPPPGVATLDETAPHDPSLTIRERLEVHRTTPGCASCHASLDPLGFALERFDAIGRAREGEVDDRGELPGGVVLDGPLGLSEALAGDPRFVHHLARTLATWCRSAVLDASAREDLEVLVQDLGPDPSLRALLESILVQALLPRAS